MSELGKAKPNVATRDLWQLAVAGDASQLEEVLSRGADIDAANAAGFTPLMLASYHGHQEMTEALIKQGADVNAGSGRITALKLAEDAGHEEIVRLLIAHGAQKNQKSRPKLKAPVRLMQEDAVEEIPEAVIPETTASPVTAVEEIPAHAMKPRASAPQVRTLQEPPEIWDIVHETPSHFDSRSALLGHLASPKSLMLAAVVFVVGGGVVLGFLNLGDLSWSPATVSQSNDNAKPIAHAKPITSRLSATPAQTKRSTLEVATSTTNAIASRVQPDSANQVTSKFIKQRNDSSSNAPVGVPVASAVGAKTKTRHEDSVGSAVADRAALRRSDKSTRSKSNSSADNTANISRTDKKETTQTSQSSDSKSDTGKEGDGSLRRAPSARAKEPDRTSNSEVISPPKASSSPKPKVIPWP